MTPAAIAMNVFTLVIIRSSYSSLFLRSAYGKFVKISRETFIKVFLPSELFNECKEIVFLLFFNFILDENVTKKTSHKIYLKFSHDNP